MCKVIEKYCLSNKRFNNFVVNKSGLLHVNYGFITYDPTKFPALAVIPNQELYESRMKGFFYSS